MSELVKGFQINDEQHLIDVASLSADTEEIVLFEGTIDCQDVQWLPDLDGNNLYEGSSEQVSIEDKSDIDLSTIFKITLDGTDYTVVPAYIQGDNASLEIVIVPSGLCSIYMNEWTDDGLWLQSFGIDGVSQGEHTIIIKKIDNNRLPSNLIPKTLNYANTAECIVWSGIVSFGGIAEA